MRSPEILNAARAVILEWMNYDPDSGDICWKEGRKYAKKVGVPLGSLCGKGYLVIYITLAGKTMAFKAHRIAWLIHAREWPRGEIDHINHIRTDNRIVNLRVVSTRENLANKGIYKSNRSGVTGVHFCSRRNAWIGQYQKDKTKVYVGRFSSPELAARAVQEARAREGFHVNHGDD